MTPERRRQVENLYQRALVLSAEDRGALFDQIDSEVRRAVESLLAHNGSMLDPTPVRSSGPAPEGAAPGSNSVFTVIGPGSQVGPYRIEKKIGSGGMGEVFRAVDLRLNRTVAIKSFSAAAGFGERFGREGRLIAQLNHPHICTLHDIGPNYLVLELVEGETLAARLKKGPLAMDEVFRYGAQIADALAAAHARGIIHRDLKPGNIMATKAGVKVLDFGIAKSADDATLTLTATGVVIGTPGYMAPEQRDGKKCDARSDIYALGLVLRELATGSRGGDLAGTPAQFAHIVARCLEPAPEDRWQAASDVRRELEWAAAIRPADLPPPAVPRSRRLAWVVASVAILGLLFAGLILYRQRAPINPASSEFIVTLNQETEESGGLPVPSPDGHLLAFPSKDLAGTGSIWIRPLDSVDARPLAGTEGSSGDIVWSPDGSWIAFYADGKLQKIHPTGGPPETIAPIPGFADGAWGSNGDIIFRSTNRVALSRLRINGGVPQPLTKLNSSLTENSHRYPTFLPDGRHFLFVSRCAERSNNALYLASLDSPDVKRIMPAQARVSYIPGAVLFYRAGTLMAQRFDAQRAQLLGEPVPVITGVAYNAPSMLASFSSSYDGEVVIAGSESSGGVNMVWFARDGEESGRLGTRGHYSQPRISPDGTRVAFESPDPQTGNRDIWSIEIARGITSRLTTNVANDWFPAWSPDSRQLAFSSDRAGGPTLQSFLKTSMDPGSLESRFRTGHPLDDDDVYDWSADGRWIAFGSRDIAVAPVADPNSEFSFLATPAREDDPRFSPDSKWIAYMSNESGRSEIYARPFSGGPAGPSGKVRISTNGGEYPVWSPAGGELFYMTGDSSIYAADIRGLGRTAAIPLPVRLFQACPGTGAVGPPLAGIPYTYAFDTHDGKKFLVVCRAEPNGRFTVLTNWRFPR